MIDIAKHLDGTGWLTPGIWFDGDGDLHFDLSVLLAEFGLADTFENRRQLIRDILHALHQEAELATIHLDA